MKIAFSFPTITLFLPLQYISAFTFSETAPNRALRRPAARSRNCHLLHANRLSENQTDEDSFFRSIRRTWPKPVQYFLRDSGMLRLIVDTLTILGTPAIIKRYPVALAQFLSLSGEPFSTIGQILFRNNNFQADTSLSKLYYGSDSRQVVHLLEPPAPENDRLIILVHGGAWGSGFPAVYRMAAKPFLDQGYRVGVVGYRTYPTTDIQGQVDDVDSAATFLRYHLPNISNVHLIGHSSGAHVSLLALLQGKLKGLDRWIGLSGVYDLPSHYMYEASRGIDRISPLAPAGGNELFLWRRYSPTWLLQRQEHLPALPPLSIFHGSQDTTVPYSSAVELSKALGDRGVEHELTRLEMGHADTILEIMFGELAEALYPKPSPVHL